MNDKDKKIIDCLKEIKGFGSFACSGIQPFVFPGLEVAGVGELSYPISEQQARELIKIARKAPYGKGSETLFDNEVRSAWEIDATTLKFHGAKWIEFLNKVLGAVKKGLGIQEDEVNANLYKMLIYEKGDFFLAHKDSEKEKGMFGTLIIGLPVRHSGGELIVRFDGKEKVIRFDEPCSEGDLPFAAFYADCDHEVRPLISGYRVALVYNLVQRQAGKSIQPEQLANYVSRLAALLKSDSENDTKIPKIVLLGHQYTPENFSSESLKLDDRTKAETLLRAAEQAGYYAKLCLVTSFQSGLPAYDGFDYDGEPDEDTPMEEVYDESLSVEHWLEEGIPPLRKFSFDEEDMLATFHINDGEPIVKECSGYMGNYGPDLMHWYHYGAVVLWSANAHEQLLPEQTTANKLEWIAYYNSKRDQLTQSEIALCENILTGPLEDKGYYQQTDYNIIADWLTNVEAKSRNHEEAKALLTKHFLKIDAGHWAELAQSYPEGFMRSVFTEMGQKANSEKMAHLLGILQYLAEGQISVGLVAAAMQDLPGCFATMSPNNQTVTPQSLRDLLYLEKLLAQNNAWEEAMLSNLTTHRQRKYINNVLAGEVMAQQEITDFAKKLLLICRDDLIIRYHNKPQPPADWSRPVPQSDTHKREWKLLEKFMQSPVERVFDYKAVKQDREQLAYAISQVTTDLEMETIRKGSPHILRITKTQAAFERKLKHWNEDAVLLKRVVKRIEDIERAA
jgi:hypothetical protein